MNKERFTVRMAVHLILIKDYKVLLSHRFQTGWEDGKYGMVAGHVEADESIPEAMIREAKEEANITVDERDLRMVHTMYRKSKDTSPYVDFFFVAKAWQGEIKNLEEHKCDELAWFPLSNLPQDTLPYVKQVLKCYEKGETFSEIEE